MMIRCFSFAVWSLNIFFLLLLCHTCSASDQHQDDHSTEVVQISVSCAVSGRQVLPLTKFSKQHDLIADILERVSQGASGHHLDSVSEMKDGAIKISSIASSSTSRSPTNANETAEIIPPSAAQEHERFFLSLKDPDPLLLQTDCRFLSPDLTLEEAINPPIVVVFPTSTKISLKDAMKAVEESNRKAKEVVFPVVCGGRSSVAASKNSKKKEEVCSSLGKTEERINVVGEENGASSSVDIFKQGEQINQKSGAACSYFQKLQAGLQEDPHPPATTDKNTSSFKEAAEEKIEFLLHRRSSDVHVSVAWIGGFHPTYSRSSPIVFEGDFCAEFDTLASVEIEVAKAIKKEQERIIRKFDEDDWLDVGKITQKTDDEDWLDAGEIDVGYHFQAKKEIAAQASWLGDAWELSKSAYDLLPGGGGFLSGGGGASMSSSSTSTTKNDAALNVPPRQSQLQSECSSQSDPFFFYLPGRIDG